MNNHSLGWAQHVRFAYAGSAAKRELGRNVLILAGLIAAYGIVGTIDYAVEQRHEADANAQSARALTATLAACMNGDATFTHQGPHTDGHQVTAVRCSKAVEYRL